MDTAFSKTRLWLRIDAPRHFVITACLRKFTAWFVLCAASVSFFEKKSRVNPCLKKITRVNPCLKKSPVSIRA